MKHLLVLRHAKSSSNMPAVKDFDRSLTEQGEKNAVSIGRLIQEENIVPDLIVSSPAKRARKTAKRIARASGYSNEVALTDNLYGASFSECIHIISKLPDSTRSVLMVGHNPIFEELVEHLTGIYHYFPTATLAHIILPVTNWCKVDITTKGELLNIWRPEELSQKYIDADN